MPEAKSAAEKIYRDCERQRKHRCDEGADNRGQTAASPVEQRFDKLVSEGWWSPSRVAWARSPTTHLASPLPIAARRRP
jgi:hypothetical protein